MTYRVSVPEAGICEVVFIAVNPWKSEKVRSSGPGGAAPGQVQGDALLLDLSAMIHGYFNVQSLLNFV